MGHQKVGVDPVRVKRLNQIIIEQGVTQKDLAEKLGICRAHISNMVNGKVGITTATAKKIQSLYPQYGYKWILGIDCLKSKKESVWKSVKTTEDWPEEKWKKYLAKVIHSTGNGGYFENVELLTFGETGWNCCDGIVSGWAEIPEDYDDGRVEE